MASLYFDDNGDGLGFANTLAAFSYPSPHPLNLPPLPPLARFAKEPDGGEDDNATRL